MFVLQIIGHSILEALRKHYLSRLDSEKAKAAMDRLYGRGGEEVTAWFGGHWGGL